MAEQSSFQQLAYTETLLKGWNRGERPRVIRLHDDDSLEVWSKLVGRVSGTREVVLLAEDDGTIRGQLVAWDSSVQVRVLAEADGTLRSQLVGWDGAAQRRVLTETNGALRNVLFGFDLANVQRALRVDNQQLLRTRDFEPYAGTAVVPLNIVATTIYTTPVATTAVVEVEFSNTDGVANTYDFHIVPSGGAAGIANRMVTGRSLAVNSIPDRLGPYHLDPGTFLQGLVTTGGGANGDINALAIVREYGTGDSVTL